MLDQSQLDTKQFAVSLVADSDIIATPGAGYKLIIYDVVFSVPVAESGKVGKVIAESASVELFDITLASVASASSISYGPAGYELAANKALKFDTDGSTGNAVISGTYAVVKV